MLSAEERITKARIALLTERPFFGRLVIRLQPVESPFVPTTATDGKYLYWNKEFVKKCNDKDLQFCMEHEVMHVVQKAFDRKPTGAKHGLWNYACDIKINHMIYEGGNYNDSPIVNSIIGEQIEISKKYETSELVYQYLLKNAPKCEACEQGIPMPDPSGKDQGSGGEGDNEEKKDKGEEGSSNSGCGGNKQPEHTCTGPKKCLSDTCSDEMTEAEKTQWQQHVISAASSARDRGDLPGWASELIGEHLKSVVRWEDIIKSKAAKAFRGRRTFKRLNRRQGNTSLRLQAWEKARKGAVLVIDTSGSISDEELLQFISECGAILKCCKAPSIDVFLHDVVCYHHFSLRKSNINKNWEVRRGGTSHVDVFKKVTEEIDNPGLIVCFTDLMTEFPPEPPGCPTVWAYPKNCGGDRIEPPFGQKVEVDMSKN